MQEQPDRVPTLHRRASEWYEQNSLPAEAIRHSLAAEDFGRAAGLIELSARAMLTWQAERGDRGIGDRSRGCPADRS